MFEPKAAHARLPMVCQWLADVFNLAKCGYLCMHAYYLYTVQSRKLELNPVRCQNIVELLIRVFPWVCGDFAYPECTVNQNKLFMLNNNASPICSFKQAK